MKQIGHALMLLSVITATVRGTCHEEMPFNPLPGTSESVSITVDDPNLGQVERTFRIHLPLGYSPDNDV